MNLPAGTSCKPSFEILLHFHGLRPFSVKNDSPQPSTHFTFPQQLTFCALQLLITHVFLAPVYYNVEGKYEHLDYTGYSKTLTFLLLDVDLHFEKWDRGRVVLHYFLQGYYSLATRAWTTLDRILWSHLEQTSGSCCLWKPKGLDRFCIRLKLLGMCVPVHALVPFIFKPTVWEAALELGWEKCLMLWDPPLYY